MHRAARPVRLRWSGVGGSSSKANRSPEEVDQHPPTAEIYDRLGSDCGEKLRRVVPREIMEGRGLLASRVQQSWLRPSIPIAGIFSGGVPARTIRYGWRVGDWGNWSISNSGFDSISRMSMPLDVGSTPTTNVLAA
jgi:hypothetical protein